MTSLPNDIRHAFRRMARNPGFTVVVVATLGLGIGASTAMFSVVDGVLLRPLPYAEPDQLHRVYLASPERDVRRGAVSLPDFEDWRERNAVFSHLAAYFSFTRNLTGLDEPAALRATYVSEDFFATMGTGAQAGRVLSPDETRRGAHVVVLSDAAWKRHFGGDPSAIGAAVSLDGVPHTVVGVMPPEFRVPGADTGLWLPLSLLVTADLVPVNRSARWLAVIGRLRSGGTSQQASSEMSAIAARLSEEYPASNEGWNHATVLELKDEIVGDVGLSLLVALGAVTFVLLLVCANLASLLLARLTSRGREIALRAALGADRVRLARELFTESLILALLGGAGGVLLATWGVDAVRSAILPILPRVEDIGIDPRVLGFALLTTVFTSLLVGMLPALRGARPELRRALEEGGRGGTGARRHRLRSGLVVGQVAVAVVLTIGAGLLLKNLQQIRGIDPGFSPDGVLAARVQIPVPPDRSGFGARIVDGTERMLDRLRALPGVEEVGSVNVLPLRDEGALLPVSAGPGQAAGEAEWLARPRTVSGDYFRVMRIPLLAGDLFPESMSADAPMSAVISQATARRLWPGEDPIGRELWMGVPYRVMGVVADVRGAGLTEEPPLIVYRHHSQQSLADVTFVIRADGEPLGLATAVREAIWSVDGSQAVTGLHELTDLVSESVAHDRFFTLLLGGFGAVALLLAALGLYGTLTYAVTRRTREIGVRMALGARRGDVLRMVLGRGMLLTGIGALLGLLAALAATRLLTGMLHQVSTTDPLVYAGITLLLLLTALLAAYVPARRATRADPMAALRSE